MATNSHFPQLLTPSAIALLLAVGGMVVGHLNAADATYPSPLATPATDDVLFAGGAPTAVSAAQVKIGGGKLTAGTAIGVGTPTPGAPLDVFASGQSAASNPGTAALRIRATADGAANPLFLNVGYDAVNDAGYLQPVHAGTGGFFSALLLNPDGGNVGIGTTAPAARFDVEGGNAIVAGSGTGGALHVGSGTENVSNTNRGLSVQDGDPNANVALAVGSTTGNSMGMVWNGAAKIGSIYTFSNAWPLVYSASFHQFSNGNVAIGGAPLGGAKLSITASSAANTALGFADTNAGGLVWSLGPGVGTGSPSAFSLYNASNSSTLLTVTSSGFLGVGTTAPASMGSGGLPTILQVNGAGAVGTIPYGLLELSSSRPQVGNPIGQVDFGVPGIGRTAMITSYCTTASPVAGYLAFHTASNTVPVERMRITENGNVGIGLTNPTSALAVNGTISAKEVIVTGNPADYVFDRDYRLRPLAEVEAFITEHKHLPGLPSAKEQEEQGEKVGDLMRAHLEKIEELNLYVIQQQKVIDDLLAQQKSRDKAFAAVLERLTMLEGKADLAK